MNTVHKSAFRKLFVQEGINSHNNSLLTEAIAGASSTNTLGFLDESGKTEIRKFILNILRYEDNYQRLKSDMKKMDAFFFKDLWIELVHLEVGRGLTTEVQTRLYPEQLKRFMELQGHKLDILAFACLKRKLELPSFREAEFAALLSAIDRESLSTRAI